MVDREKVIKGLECCHAMVHDLGPSKSSCGICPYKDVQTEEQIDLGGIECIAVLHDDVLALLKEQEAVEPIRDATCVRMFRCGACGAYVGFVDSDLGVPNEQDNYCRNCGRPVKWDG